MNVWLIKDGENLPVQRDARKMRMWMLADELVGRGHSVTWWSSTHSHQRKTLLAGSDRDVDITNRFRLKMLHAGRYRSNRSLRRLLHHARLARHFRRESANMPRPDIIVSAFPVIEMANEAARYARTGGVPIVVDIRDPWPDAFVELVPSFLRGAARLALWPLQRQARHCLSQADSLVACSDGFLDWGLAKAGLARRPVDRVFYLGSPRREDDRPTLPPRIALLRNQLAGKVVFTFVGSFGHVYQLRLICETAEALDRQGDQRPHFVLAGDGQQFAELTARYKRLVNVTFPGWLDAREVDALLSISDVGLAPIRQMSGCVPNKIFEYSSAGLPILSSLEGEAEAILARHGAGLSYSPGDHAKLLEHVKLLASDEASRREWARCSHEMFERSFAASHIYRDFADHVERIAGVRPD